MNAQEITQFIESRLSDTGFSHFGIAKLARPLTFDFYQTWLNENLYGSMNYLKEHASIKENPQSKWPEARSCLVFAMPYFPHPEPQENPPLEAARMSMYSKGMDYHFWFRGRMQELCNELKGLFPSEEFLAFTDSSPLLERDLAQRAGLGWYGKNTCIIHPKKGSLFFIGEIITSLSFEANIAPLPDFCGKCTRCIDICPTEALIAPQKMDASRCISYLTIESRNVPAPDLREKIGDWFFGCDLCQTTCPWNQKVFKNQLSTHLIEEISEDHEEKLIKEMRYILESSGKKLSKDFLGTPLARAGSFGLKRNALIVIANRKLTGLEDAIIPLLEHEKLGELAQWTLDQLNG